MGMFRSNQDIIKQYRTDIWKSHILKRLSPDGPLSEPFNIKAAWETLPFYIERRKWTHFIHSGVKPADIPRTTRLYKNPIHEARRYADIYALPSMGSYAQVANHFGVSRARVCQMMNLLKLPENSIEHIAGIEDQEELKKYTERKLRELY